MIPRRIWTLWLQGLDAAPTVPRSCVASWYRHNPNWEIVVLDAESLPRWVDASLIAEHLTPQQVSDLVRLALLEKHGGVWVDATCFCTRPLDDWLPPLLGSGFFAFARPGPDRLLASWFMASDAHSYVALMMLRKLSRYLLRHAPASNRLAARVVGRVTRRLDRNPYLPVLWFAFPLPQVGLKPYFAIHYMFARLVLTSRRFRRVWKRTPQVSADGPHSLHAGFDRPPSRELLDDIRRRDTPVFKLNWRLDPEGLQPGSALNLLLATGASSRCLPPPAL